MYYRLVGGKYNIIILIDNILYLVLLYILLVDFKPFVIFKVKRNIDQQICYE